MEKNDATIARYFDSIQEELGSISCRLDELEKTRKNEELYYQRNLILNRTTKDGDVYLDEIYELRYPIMLNSISPVDFYLEASTYLLFELHINKLIDADKIVIKNNTRDGDYVYITNYRIIEIIAAPYRWNAINNVAQCYELLTTYLISYIDELIHGSDIEIDEIFLKNFARISKRGRFKDPLGIQNPKWWKDRLSQEIQED